MPTNINPLTPSATTGIVTLSSTGAAFSVLPSGNNQVVGNDGAGNVAAVTLVAGANMAITQTANQIEFVSAGGSGATGLSDVVPVTNSYLTSQVVTTVANIGTTQASSTQAGLVAATTAFPANSLVQIESTGAVPCSITSTDGTVVVTPSSGSIDLSAAITAASAVVDLYSPVNFTSTTIPSDIVITADYTSQTPALADMQVIATSSITCTYDGSVGGAVQCSAIIGYHTTNTSELGAQFALYVSTQTPTAPVSPAPLLQQGAMSSSAFNNTSATSLSFEVPSVRGQEITFTLAASKLAGTTVTVESGVLSMLTEEVLANTGSIVASKSISLLPTPITVTEEFVSVSQLFSTITPVINSTITKQYSNSYLELSGNLQAVGVDTDTAFWGYSYVYVGASGLATDTPVTNSEIFAPFGTGGTTPVGGQGMGGSASYGFYAPGTSIPAGTYDIAVGCTVQTGTASTLYNIIGGSLIVNEVLPFANGGVINVESFGQFTTNGAIPTVSTTSPQYSQTFFGRSITITTRANGSLCYVDLSCTSNAQPSAGTYLENMQQYLIYISNSPTALPVASFRRSFPRNPANAPRNATTSFFRYYFTSPAPNTPYTFYLCATKMTSISGNTSFSSTMGFFEIFTGNILDSGIASVDAQANSYLTAQTTGAEVVIDSVLASTTQAGLVALASATPANSLIQMGATVPVACTLTSLDSSVTITPSEGSIDLSASSSAGLGIAWTTTSTGIAMLPNRGYYLTNTAGVITMTIGTGFVLGSVIQIQCAVGFSGVSIQTSATQSINVNDLTTSPSGAVFAGTGGMVIDITCTVADSQFSVSASQVCQVS